MLENLKNIESKSWFTRIEKLSSQISDLAMNTINSAIYCWDCWGVMVRKWVRMVCKNCMD